MKLYELASDFIELMELEEVTEEQKNEIISVILNEIENKSENILKLLKNYDAEIEVLDEEIKRLQQCKKRKTTQSNNLKTYMLSCMETMGKKKIETPLGNITLRNSINVEVQDIKLVPKEFISEKIEYTVDKNAVKEQLKQGIEINGVSLKTKTSVITPKLRK